MAQTVPFMGEKDPLKILQQQHDYTRHCLNEFRKEKQLSMKLMLGGAVVTYFALNDELNGYNKAINDRTYRYTTGRDGETLAFENPRTNQGKIDKIKLMKVACYAVGGTAAVAGIVFQVIPYRWMKRAYIGKDGIGIKIKL